MVHVRAFGSNGSSAAIGLWGPSKVHASLWCWQGFDVSGTQSLLFYALLSLTCRGLGAPFTDRSVEARVQILSSGLVQIEVQIEGSRSSTEVHAPSRIHL